MNLTDHASQTLSQLSMAPGAYLLGKRADDGTPFALIDKAAMAQTHSLPLASREAVNQLLAAGYLSDESGTGESINVGYVLSKLGWVARATGTNRPERITLSFTPSEDYEAARTAVSELNQSLSEAGAVVSILLQESYELPPLVLYVGSAAALARVISPILIAFIKRNRAIVKITKPNGAEISIDASEELVRDLLQLK
jgi:hypothetical protein